MTRNAPVAIVTGGANGIGKSIAKRLQKDGWRLAVIDKDARHLSSAFRTTTKIVTFDGDVTDEFTVQRIVAGTLDKFGRLDALVSNAGVMVRKPIAQLSLPEWRRVIDTNLTATFLLARAAEKALRKSKGAIVTVASTRAAMSEPNTESYSASKGGIVALTHALSISLGPEVRVNTVSPGWIETGRYSALKKRDHAQHPVGRVGKPTDLAEIVAFLLDREKSGFITGANFTVDGGMTRKMIYED